MLIKTKKLLTALSLLMNLFLIGLILFDVIKSNNQSSNTNYTSLINCLDNAPSESNNSAKKQDCAKKFLIQSSNISPEYLLDYSDEDILKAFRRAQIRNYAQQAKYSIWAQNHRIYQYQSQLLLFYLIFIVIVMLIAFSLYLTFQEIKKQVEPPKQALKISLQGIEASSSITGLLIFIVSGFFLNIYINKIYKIDNVQSGKTVENLAGEIKEMQEEI